MGNFMPTVCTARTPSTCSAPSHPVRPRKAPRSPAESAISSAHTTSPSRRSHPDRIRARLPDDLWRVRLSCPLMSKRTVKRKLRTKKKANHGKKPNCGRG